MHQNCRAKVASFCLLGIILFVNFSAHSQVVAGIRANGKIRAHGDTIRVCKGNTITYQSAAQGSLNVYWKFNGGSPSLGTGILPIPVKYDTVGFDTTYQRVVGGTFADSTFVIVHVSDVYPVADFAFLPDNVCANEVISFTNNSTGDGLIWSWNFGDGLTSNVENPAHQFLSAVGLPPSIQVFPVQLVVANSLGCRDTVVRSVTVKKIPDASVGNADPTVSFGTFNGIKTFKKCNNIPSYHFRFQNISSTIPNNASYTIKWGDGTPDSVGFSWAPGQIIGHTFPIGGSRMIVSINGIDGCVGIKEYAVFLGTSPSGGLVGPGNTDICSSDSLYFSIAGNPLNPNPPGTVYTMMINDGSAPQVYQHPPPASIGHHFELGSCFSTSTAGLQTYNNAYGAYLTIENPCGSTSGSVVPIYVSGKPKPVISLPGPVICVNTAVTIANASSYGNVISATGTFTSDCINNGVKVWEISPATGYTLLSGALGSLNGSPGDGSLWTDGSNALNIIFTATGNYQIKLHVYNDRCGVATTIQNICVRNPPQASFSLTQRSSCGPVLIQPANTSPAGGCQGDDYEWDIQYADPLNCAAPSTTAFSFEDGSSATSASPSVQLNKVGRYVIRLLVRARNASYSCPEVYATDTFYVKGPPQVTLNPLNNACVNNPVLPTANILNCYSAGAMGYQWTFNNAIPATSGSLSPGAIQYATAGAHQVRLIVTDSSCMLSDTAFTTVNIVALPVAEAGNDASLCSIANHQIGTTPIAGVSYSWTPATGLSNPSLANPVANLIYSGPLNDTLYTYYLNASMGSGCSSMDSVKITVKRTPAIVVSPVTAEICVGQTAVFSATGADTYSWSPAAGLNSTSGNSVTASPAGTTIYTVTGSLLNGCTDSKTITLTVHPDANASFTVDDTLRCVSFNLDTVINNNLFPAGNGTYNWFANGVLFGSNTSGIVPSFVIDQPDDTISVKLVTISQHGCRPDSIQRTFITRPNVLASFSKDKDSACAPLNVHFTNTSSSLPHASFYWNFGNGITSTAPNPGTITFQASPEFRDTTYRIILKAFNGCDTTVYRDSVKVFANSKARFSVDTTRGCSPFTVSIQNTSAGNNTAYYWDFGDGQRDTTFANGPLTHTYYTGAIASFPIRLISQNQCTRDTQTIVLQVSPNIIQPFITVNGDQVMGCSPHAVTFNNSTMGASLQTWNFGDGSPLVVIPNNQNSIGHVYTAAGTYNVSIKLENDCSDTTIQRAITVYQPPVALFELGSNRSCTGQAVEVNNNSVGANSWQWFWGDGTTSSFEHGQHLYSSAGTYTVMLVAKKVHPSGFICSDTITKEVTIVEKILAQIAIGPGKFCAPYTLRADAITPPGYSSLKWVVYDSSRAEQEFHLAGPSATHVYDKPGMYSVKLVVYTAPGCADSTVRQFRVYSTPITSFEPRLITTCSHDTTVAYTAVTTNQGADAVSYQWFKNGSIEGTTNPFNHHFRSLIANTSPIEFTIRALAQNVAGCGDTSLAGKLIMQPLPYPRIEVSPSLVLTQPDYEFTFKDAAATNPNKFYTWHLGDRTQQTKEGREVTYEYGDTGRYTVRLKVVDYSTGCKAEDSIRVSILHVPGYLHVPNAMCVGCSNFSLRQFLPMGKGLKTYRLRIYNSFGQKIFETSRLDANGSPNEPWDALYKNQPLQQDVFTWQIEATYINGTEWKGMLFPGSSKHIKSGFITVIK